MQYVHPQFMAPGSYHRQYTPHLPPNSSSFHSQFPAQLPPNYTPHMQHPVQGMHPTVQGMHQQPAAHPGPILQDLQAQLDQVTRSFFEQQIYAQQSAPSAQQMQPPLPPGPGQQ
ncbi:hypothetical protein AAF712_008793 [Marasmius tenuissimus]|uniref:Uncharacterized protein n=1 Tax=Marasmius tenuissimus TaxID=585030 RepID=A0ABR2ZS60_9AGAR